MGNVMEQKKSKPAKRRLKAIFAKMKRFRVKTWVLLVLLLPLGFVDATLLRLSHIRMTELRSAVLEIDAKISENESDEEMAANDKELEDALVRLKEYVFHHIVVNVVEENGVSRVTFGTGPFYLERQYLRAAHRALEKAEAELASDDSNPYGNIYGEAGETCRAAAIENGWTWDSSEFINCMLTEIQKYPAADDLQGTIIASLPSTELYRKNYASPVWAPSAAGFLLIITLIIILILIFRLIYYIVIRIALIFV